MLMTCVSAFPTENVVPKDGLALTELEIREAAAANQPQFPKFDTHDAAWAKIKEAKEKGAEIKEAYITSTNTFISDIKIEGEMKQLAKRFSVGGLIKHFIPNAGKVIPGISFTEWQVNLEGAYFAPWKPSSCPFYNDKSNGPVSHNFTVTISKSICPYAFFKLKLASYGAIKYGGWIYTNNEYTRLDCYQINPGQICQLWERPYRYWQNQQTRECKKSSFSASSKTCTGWGAIMHGDFLLQNKTIPNLRCGDNNVLKNNCGT